MGKSDSPTHELTCPIWGLSFLPVLIKTLHGSFARDFDFVAIPWSDDAKPATVLVEAIREAVGGVVNIAGTEKPHGRKAWSIHVGSGPYIDLSVMPRSLK